VTAPRTPYPPDPDDDTVVPEELEDLTDAVVDGKDWSNRRSLRLSLRRVELKLCRLTGTELAESTLEDVTFTECRLDLAGLRFAKLERVVFRDCRMGESDFGGATLVDVLLEGCELRDADLSAAKATRVELRGCTLEGLRGVEALRGARMPWNDVLENAPLFAAALGIQIVD